MLKKAHDKGLLSKGGGIRHALIALAAVLYFISPAFALPSVTILADPSMGPAVAEIARNYSREHNVVASTVFTSSSEQQDEINEGGSADVLITPKLGWIETLKTQGLIDVHSEIAVAKNRMALIGPIDSTLNLKIRNSFPSTELIHAMEGEQLFVVGHPETLLEGIYGREALRNLDPNHDMEEYTLYIKNLDQMFEMVRKSHAYGLFFYSSAISRTGIRVIDLLPEDSHHPIDYHAVAIAGDNMGEARKFLDYLKSASARKTLRENGFGVEK